jgi:hypothetical protein
MGKIRLGRYPGKANSAFGVKWFFKPALGKVVGRFPGVNRKSERVLERNRTMRAKKPASVCKGKAWDDFTACLSEELAGGAKRKA